MTWVYHQSTGALWRDGKCVAEGYSGHGPGKNNPEMQDLTCVGPIPRGLWRVVEMVPETASHGNYVLRLKPDVTTVTHRDGFLVHGDSRKAPGTASLGCIILARPVRELLWCSGDRTLEVVA